MLSSPSSQQSQSLPSRNYQTTRDEDASLNRTMSIDPNSAVYTTDEVCTLYNLIGSISLLYSMAGRSSSFASSQRKPGRMV